MKIRNIMLCLLISGITCTAQANMLLMYTAIEDDKKEIENVQAELAQQKQKNLQDAIDSRSQIIAVAGDNQDPAVLTAANTAKEELVALQEQQLAQQQQRQREQEAEIKSYENMQDQIDAFSKQSSIEMREFARFLLWIIGALAIVMTALFLAMKRMGKTIGS